MEFETPDELLGRLKLGREEYCQRLLTTLILHTPYPRWNTRSIPAPAGVAFLTDIYQRSFGGPWSAGQPVFVDEFELPSRHDDEKGGAPDYAVLFDDRVWLIELKTEKASHRHDQIPGYFELAHHHYPKAAVDLLYVTPPMDAPYQPEGDWARYAHTTWGDLVEPIRSAWPVGVDPGQQAVIDGLLAVIAGLDRPQSEWRTANPARADVVAGPPPTVTPVIAALPVEPAAPDDAGEIRDREHSAFDEAFAAAQQTAEDGRQRAVDRVLPSLEDLLALRLEVRDALAATPAESPLRHVLPWIWQPASLGAPLTAAGDDCGMELRLSRYATPRY